MATKRKPSEITRCSNSAEAEALEALREKGFRVYRRGWPDFFALDENNEMIAIEVKPRPSTRLKANQELVMRKLAQARIPCFRFDPVDGFTRLF